MRASSSPTFDAVQGVLSEFAELESALADPALHSDPARARRVGRRYAELRRVVSAYRTWQTAEGDAAAAIELAAEDPGFSDEAAALVAVRDEASDALRRVLVPGDPDDGRDVLIEIRAGEGGEESALFAAELMRMYERYAERQNWSTHVLELTGSDLGGIKDATLAVKARSVQDPSDGVWAHLKYEGGVHRVQRVPVTESAGRVHTSAVGVVVLPEADDEAEVDIDPADLRIDVYRSSGPGGQSVNTTDSAVRITHGPSGLVVSCQNEKSQLQNKEQALRILRARLLAARQEEAEAEATRARRSQVRTADRSERIRTYNFGENRIADHRTGYKAYNLDQVLDGDLGPVVASAIEADDAARLAAAARA